ncbi:MAG: hypothetical protein OXI11_03180 [Gammaproteobacteria bacterium]|nr:hypothetical protein [Gammaproteobacteria bacterium]MXW45981.1 hypothetical protein [Gammaproteobacteria bacterium]MYD02456.1 hypothetical protein [Gammaproteobacteria bacterium]MYI25942.1 hypothetical protein [Gammaproteobacteria bacterium]
MKHLKPPQPDDGRVREAMRKRRTAIRFGFSAVIASFVVLAMLILGAMFQEEYEEGFVRIVTFAVRLATPEEVAQAEAQGPIPDPFPSIRPDTPIVVSTDPLVPIGDAPQGQILLPAPEALIPLDDVVVETIEGLELLAPDNPENEEETAETE